MPYGKKPPVKKATFKPCRGCPTPAACKKAGKCKGKK